MPAYNFLPLIMSDSRWVCGVPCIAGAVWRVIWNTWAWFRLHTNKVISLMHRDARKTQGQFHQDQMTMQQKQPKNLQYAQIR